MELSRSLTLPSIKVPSLQPRYHGMPRRYEETKPVIIQDFTHRKIVGIGHEIQRRLLEKLDTEKSSAVEEAKAMTWEEAEKQKNKAVKKARDEGTAKVAKALEEQAAEHAQKMKEEIIRVEMEMQKRAIEQVQQERAKGEKATAKAVKETEERCAKELEKAVDEAHIEEQRIAAENIKNLTRKHNAYIDDLRKAHVVELAQQLALLETRKNQEREDAVKAAHEYEQKVTKEIVEKLKQKYEALLAEEVGKIDEKAFEIEKLNKQIEEIEMEKERLADFLRKTRAWFQDFIDRVHRVKHGEADFMLPPAYIKEIERGLMDAQ